MIRGKYRKHIWEERDLNFLKDNYSSMTNAQLANGLGLTLTITRTKLYELGLTAADSSDRYLASQEIAKREGYGSVAAAIQTIGKETFNSMIDEVLDSSEV